jgi:hypothetical protein
MFYFIRVVSERIRHLSLQAGYGGEAHQSLQTGLQVGLQTGLQLGLQTGLQGGIQTGSPELTDRLTFRSAGWLTRAYRQAYR